jgi:large subunit ribosomal protein L5
MVQQHTLPRLQEKYRREIVPAMMSEFGYANVMQVPRLKRIVINIGLGEAIQNAKALEAAEKDLAAISGQHPVITRAKKSIAAFKLRAGMPIGMMVTLRGRRMYEFLDRLINAVLPRIRDFRGMSRTSFDGRGNYSLGLKDQLVFPEIEYDKVDKARGLEVTIVTTASSNEEGRHLLELLGFPFMRG